MKLPKPTSANPLDSARPAKPISSTAILFILLAIVFAAGAIFFLNHRAQANRQQAQEATLAADKARFAQVETDMAKTYAAIIASTGKPDVEKQFKNCSYIELKFEKGPLVCSVSYNFTFGADAQQAAALVGNVDSALESASNLKPATHLASSFDAGDPEQMAATDLQGAGPMTCKLSYELGITLDVDKKVIENPRSTFFRLNCSQNVQYPIYTLAN